MDNEFIKIFYKFIFKPELNIFLYASPDVILTRKDEMDRDSIVLLTEMYSQFFCKLDYENGNRYISIENIDKNLTLKIIEDIYTELLNV